MTSIVPFMEQKCSGPQPTLGLNDAELDGHHKTSSSQTLSDEVDETADLGRYMAWGGVDGVDAVFG